MTEKKKPIMLTPSKARALAERLGRLHRLVEMLRERNERLDMQLGRALHELAIERGIEPQLFIRRWLRAFVEQEEEEEVGVRIERIDKGASPPSR